MGYSKDRNEFWPDETATEFYLQDAAALDDIIEKATEKWPGIKFANIKIEPRRIHLYCLGYDCYDPGDWGDFLCILKTS